MTKIRDMAKISPLKTPIKKVTPMLNAKTLSSLSKRPRGNPNNPGFKQWLADRHNQQVSFQEILEMAIYDFEQPITIPELAHYIKKELGTDYPLHRFRYSLDQLTAAGKILTRIESSDERALRADGAATGSKHASYFYRGDKVEMPKRTVAHIVEGFKLYDLRQNPGMKPKGKASVTELHPQPTDADIQRHPAATKAQSNEALDFLIEKLVAERTKDLQAQLDAANAKLAQFKKLLS